MPITNGVQEVCLFLLSPEKAGKVASLPPFLSLKIMCDVTGVNAAQSVFLSTVSVPEIQPDEKSSQRGRM